MSLPKTPEAQARQASGNTSAKDRKARAASPWNRGPMCDGPSAMESFKRYRQHGHRAERPTEE